MMELTKLESKLLEAVEIAYYRSHEWTGSSGPRAAEFAEKACAAIAMAKGGESAPAVLGELRATVAHLENATRYLVPTSTFGVIHRARIKACVAAIDGATAKDRCKLCGQTTTTPEACWQCRNEGQPTTGKGGN